MNNFLIQYTLPPFVVHRHGPFGTRCQILSKASVGCGGYNGSTITLILDIELLRDKRTLLEVKGHISVVACI